MVDRHTRAQRRYNMSRIKNKGTSLELRFRKMLCDKGFRGYRLNYNLPGKPDMVFTRFKLAIFLDGCFWHKCPKCFKYPSSNKKFWKEKILKNEKRDKIVNKELSKEGYKILRFWQHEIKENPEKCISGVRKLLKL